MKYQNSPVIMYGIQFDSKWECEVYRLIKSIIPPSYISVHERVLIKPTTKNYRARYWNCDFIIKDDFDNPLLLVEAKGMPTREFLRQLQLLDAFEPTLIGKIRIVQQQSTKIDECFTSLNPTQLQAELKIVSKQLKGDS
ncbi:hypothetical protein PL11201_290005 [Planktothrix sp. PCC 11201]|uniref:DUF1064 domain-containing protein n=1 Tax=Planktothrix sp. PCC 11201 TaxID=1729650 RepID=UPI00091CD4DF|nr:DUF1064 domain-containing protein [Planktothrix sp. PCC 11201]SKB12037.1 hypothetical protein PL11201_290005 [Planktothrix sp. PCC 11201]